MCSITTLKRIFDSSYKTERINESSIKVNMIWYADGFMTNQGAETGIYEEKKGTKQP